MVIDKPTLMQLLDKLKHELNKLNSMEFDLEDILSDEDIQDLVNRRMQVAIETCIDIATMLVACLQLKRSDDAGDVFRELARAKILTSELAEKMAKAVGFKNVLVHEYVKIDYKKVFIAKNENLDDLRKFCVFHDPNFGIGCQF